MESHASLTAIFSVPPFLSEGFTTFSSAALNSGCGPWLAALPASPVPELFSLPPPQADRPRLIATAAARRAVEAYLFLIWFDTPCGWELLGN